MKEEFVNIKFQSLLSNDFDTENVSIFLYSLIKCCRPKQLLEVGCGYSTIFLTKAIEDTKKEIDTKQHYQIANQEFWKKEYKPSLEIIEDGSDKLCGENYKKVLNILQEQNLDQYVKFNFCSAYDFMNQIQNKNIEYDFIWLDFGSGQKYMEVFDAFFNKLSSGGILIIHSTLSNLLGRLFVTELKLEQKNRNDFELISFFEPHKIVQNSFTVIRKVDNTPIYTVQA